MTLQTRDLILVGLGNVHRQLLRLLDTRADTLAHRYGLHLRVVGACDSGGVVIDDSGLNVRKLLAHKEAGNTVGDFPGGRSGATALDVLSQLCADAAHPPDALLEASPVNLTNAEPALSFVRAALQQSVDVVLANKAPLALRFSELQRLADQHGTRLAFSATVCGGLPVVNVGTRDLVASRIKRVQGIFNSTSNYILSEMAKGDSFEQALAEAQRRGIAEADPSLDVDGWDTANKLTIVANAVLGYPSTVRDVQPVTGIREAQGNEYGPEWKLVGTADLLDSGASPPTPDASRRSRPTG